MFAYVCVPVQGIFDVWGEGSSFEEMLQSIAAHPFHQKAPYLAPDASFKVVMSTVGFRWRPEDHKHYIHQLVEAVGFEGRVALDDPQHEFWIVTVSSSGEGGVPAMPTRWVFGRQVALVDRLVGGIGDGRKTRQTEARCRWFEACTWCVLKRT